MSGHAILPGQYRAFGALRCLLAGLVAMQHFQYLLPEGQRGPFRALGLGVTSVGVFFVISGFIVAEAIATFYQARPRAFLLNRLLRVVPPYLAALALSVAAHQLLWQQNMLRVWDFTFTAQPLDPALILASLTALLPFVHGGQGAGETQFIPFVWSLRIEIAFYLTVCLACLALPWAGRRIGAAQAHRLLVHLGFVAGFACYALLLIAGRPLMLLDIPFFLLGVAIYRLSRGSTPERLAWLCAAAVASWWSMRHWPQPPGLERDAQAALFILLSASFVAVARLRPSANLHEWDSMLGSLSYPLYLNHYVVGILIFDITAARGWPIVGAGLLLSLALAWLMHRVVEQPLAHFRNRVRGTVL